MVIFLTRQIMSGDKNFNVCRVLFAQASELLLLDATTIIPSSLHYRPFLFLGRAVILYEASDIGTF